ncbi:MAG: formate dehydrogenase accessory sulfurtransferase FdhD [Acidobacteria bacterium]|nr:MAG: formate dehydrogenase accessory sulfurtransferase FdhD [Acidobacteriota bacterium]
MSMVDVRSDQLLHRVDELVTEEPMEVRVVAWRDGRWVPHPVTVTMRTPGDDFELAAGFLFTEGVVTDPHMITHITYCTNPLAYCTDSDELQKYNIVTVYLHRDVTFDAERLSRHVYTTSSCGICGKASLELVRTICDRRPVGAMQLSSDYFHSLPQALDRAQSLFQRTGGLHAAALFDVDGQLLLLREDIGRHNAMDKLIGALFLNRRLPASDTVVLVSGRASFELVQKAIMAGIPVMAAVGAPSNLAVELAREYGMTLIGFLREGRFNVYAGHERLAMNISKTA